MAGTNSVLTITLVNATSVTLTFLDGSFYGAKQAAQNIARDGGVWADDGAWYPSSAILKIVPSTS